MQTKNHLFNKKVSAFLLFLVGGPIDGDNQRIILRWAVANR